ncbi:restriction endonuclease subunit S [Bradyrhizobium sp. USDA 3364]
MPSEWETLTLVQAGIRLIDCDHRTPPAVESGYPYIAIPQLKDGHIDLSGVRRISPEHFIDWTKKLLPQEHDVIVVRRCNSGVSAVVPQYLQCAIGQNLVVLRADGKRIRPRFLRWLVRGDEWWEQVRKYINVGAVFDSLKCRDIPNFEVLVPPLDEQDQICDTLDALDRRIDLLRQTNATLESIAQALFKSWFIDFDPVRAKAEGREPEGMTATTAALFPNEFEESALGLIPKGWRVGKVDDLLVLQRGFDLPALQRTEGSFPVLAASGPNGSHHEAMVEGPGVTTGRSGVIGNVYFVHENFWPLNTSLWVKQFKVATPAFAYQFLKTLNLKRLNAGSAVPTLNRNHVHAQPAVIPPSAVVSSYTQVASTLLMRVRANEQHVGGLSELRDTLLPRLISGKLRLPKAEARLEEAAE